MRTMRLPDMNTESKPLTVDEKRILVCEKLLGWTKDQIDAVLVLEKLNRQFHGWPRRRLASPRERAKSKV